MDSSIYSTTSFGNMLWFSVATKYASRPFKIVFRCSPEEANLDSGRFRSFRHNRQRHVLQEDRWHSDINGAYVEERINWIAENIVGEWCVEFMQLPLFEDGYYVYSFATERDAVAYKMRFM